MVSNYLKGQQPPAFDLLYWNGDSTNLPGPMYAYYLRNTYHDNKLVEPDALTMCGVPVDLKRVDMPAFVFAAREDHIVPWKGGYESARYLGGPVKFVLGASGHIAGSINPASKNKRSYWTNDRLGADADKWFAQSKEVPGSWWVPWTKWLKPFARQAGRRAHEAGRRAAQAHRARAGALREGTGRVREVSETTRGSDPRRTTQTARRKTT